MEVGRSAMVTRPRLQCKSDLSTQFLSQFRNQFGNITVPQVNRHLLEGKIDNEIWNQLYNYLGDQLDDWLRYQLKANLIDILKNRLRQ